MQWGPAQPAVRDQLYSRAFMNIVVSNQSTRTRPNTSQHDHAPTILPTLDHPPVGSVCLDSVSQGPLVLPSEANILLPPTTLQPGTYLFSLVIAVKDDPLDQRTASSHTTIHVVPGSPPGVLIANNFITSDTKVNPQQGNELSHQLFQVVNPSCYFWEKSSRNKCIIVAPQ